MLKKSSNVLLMTLCILIVFTSLSFGSNLNNAGGESKEKLYEDFLLTFLSTYILEGIHDYYGEYRQYMDAKVLSIERLEEGSYYFKIVVQVTTFVGAHNPPYGIEIVTIQQDVHGIKVIDFNHEDFKDDNN
ncbi:hypothetical protein Curi_c14590 [Gottschalkia acidurici 9a]|uniref:DUF3888 domain-containing protein n=1 Tax=Gottschalkia acidurici (strain ATCC 7906 / DSM 604 / BCRC 14475 / CIP 104303 / KCTC 5404 / NCIMB 10678 / 9a) TaxID=1128398 RepID=K0AYY8_GOTA9|nr:DUF3888 domain-containing protein [Gottschalkia acidurici]AFS78469.1 hypothetical protein Curi_c14590 [Gottschalkia acidurici 9a]